jgi:hypothetical protein
VIGLGHTVTVSYLRPDKHETEIDKTLLRKLGITLLRAPLLTENVKEEFRLLVREVKPDLIIMTLWFWQPERPWFNVPGLFVTFMKTFYPNVPLIIISDDVHWLRLKMLHQHKNSVKGQKQVISRDATVSSLRQSEYSSYGQANAVIAISLTDKYSSTTWHLHVG